MNGQTNGIDYSAFDARITSLSNSFLNAKPFPHLILDDFLPKETIKNIIQTFPNHSDSLWNHYKHVNCYKLASKKIDLFPDTIKNTILELNSERFLNFLSELTGIDNLIADPSLEGGGLHQIENGGYLNIHADFTVHHIHMDQRRRLNLILYLNESWQDGYNGELELWDESMTKCVQKVQPIANRAVIFRTNDSSYHGHPAPLAGPEGFTRKSIALYYYTKEKNIKINQAHSTDFKSTPDDSKLKSVMIYLDKKLLHYYSRLKQCFGFSDDFVSKLLKRLSIFKKD